MVGPIIKEKVEATYSPKKNNKMQLKLYFIRGNTPLFKGNNIKQVLRNKWPPASFKEHGI
jgi:hypothetical protein